MEVRPDPWLAEALGRPVFRVEQPDDAPASLRTLRAHLGGHPRALDYAKVPAERAGVVGALEQEGFRVVDTALRFRRAASAAGAPAPGKVEVGSAAPGEAAALEDIAGRSFRFSRFHLDPQVPRPAADAVKRAWLRSYLDGARGMALDAARLDGRLAGFNAILEARGAGGRTRIIDLIAVAPEFQGMGVGRALVGHFVREHAGQCDALEVGTQAANVPSVRLYESVGFRLAAAEVVLHRHHPEVP